MTQTRKLSLSPLAKDIDMEVDFLREHAGGRIATEYVRAVRFTAELLLQTPYIGRECNFQSLQLREVRRFPVHSPFQKRLIFYIPTLAEVRIERVLHGARNWRPLFE